MIASLAVALIIAVLACVFALQNSTPVVITFFSWKFTHSLALTLLATFSVGVLAGCLGMLPALWRKSRLVAAQKKAMKRLASEDEEEEAEFLL